MRFRDVAAMRIVLRVFEFLLKFFAEWLVDEVFDAIGGGVDVVGREAEVLDEVGFPEAVATDESRGAPAAVVGHIQLAVADFDAAAATQHAESPTRKRATADGGDGFVRPQSPGGIDFFQAVEH
jgi:hypothetical protein